MKKYLLTLVVSAVALQIGFGQSLSAFEKAGKQALQKKDYYAALTFFQKALYIDPDNIDLIERLAYSTEQFGAMSIAENMYNKVISSDQASRYPEALFRLGEVQRNMGKYETAKATYQQFIDKNRNNSKMDALVVQAERGITNSNWAINVKQDSTESYKVAQLSQEINTPYSDFSPIKRGDTLYYSSLQFEKPKDDYEVDRLLSKVLTSVSGEKGVNVPDAINVKQKHVAHTAFTPDGSGMYYTICDYVGETTIINCEIYYKEKDFDDTWKKEVKLPDFINVPNYTSTQPNVGVMPDGRQVLFFTSNQPGSLDGSLDIWYSTIESKGVCAQPVNLREINTSQNDVTPFYHNEDHALFFSSEGYQNMGGYDIYKSKKTPSTWADVEHLGYPINSSYNDVYYSYNKKEAKAYFSSNRLGATFIDKERETCCNDIYEAIYADLRPQTFNAINKQPLDGVTVHVVEAPADNAREDTKYDDHEYYFPLGFEKQYNVYATKEGWEPSQTINISTEDLNNSMTFVQPLYLTPKVDLKAFTFDEITKEPLNGVTVELIEIVSDSRDPKTNENGNEYDYDLAYGKRYRVTAYKEGYSEPEPIIVTTEELAEPKSFLEKFYLRKLLPKSVVVYFDNDRPDEDKNVPETETNYENTFKDYIAKKEDFENRFRKARKLNDNEKDQAINEVRWFFDNEVQGGYDRLVKLTEEMKPLLAQGRTIKLKVQGFASPRYKEKDDGGYNHNLACRRVMSIRNYLAAMEGISQYLDNKLILEEECLGDTPSRGKAPDKMSDRLGSIFSVDASRWRKVQIDVVELSELKN